MTTGRRNWFHGIASLISVAMLLCLDVGRAAEIWSLEPVKRPAAPATIDTVWPSSGPLSGAIDRFILAKLESKGLTPAAVVSRQKLVRRVYFDLWGLPPMPEAVQAFVADSSPEAYPRLVDELLASPHYGERWGRYWLDVVRFADTNGYERDAEKKNAWKYRDWVIESLNRDKPYDRFIVEQLAGDELPDANEETRVATGFLRIGTFDDEPNDPLQYKFEQLDDLVHATSTAFLAITIRCARCHDHKFDPIPQTDYYSILNFFANGKAADGELLAYTDANREPPKVHLLKGGDPRAEGEVVPAGFLNMIPQWRPVVAPPKADSATSQQRLQFAHWIADGRNPLTARVMVNRVWQQHFGEALARTSDNFGNTGHSPTHPELLDWLADEFMAGGWRLKRLHRMILLSSTYQMDSVHRAEADYAGQDAQNELWWRTNRRRLDAESLRDTMLCVSGELSDQMGGPGYMPTVNQDALEGLSMKSNAWHASSPAEQNRRSVYMYTKRALPLPLLSAFDFADTSQPCTQRTRTTVAPQALALLNNEFVHGRSERLSARVAREVPGETTARIDRLWWLTLGRAPSDLERISALAHVDRQRALFAAADPATKERAGELALTSLCHVLLNTNAFIYVD